MTVEKKNTSSQYPPPQPLTPGWETERQPLFCPLCPLRIARAESNVCVLSGGREKREGKGEESEGEWCEWQGRRGERTAEVVVRSRTEKGRRGGV